MASRALALLALVVVAGCTPTLRDGVFACTSDGECPGELRCRADHLCYRDVTPSSDGGVSSDGSACPTGDCVTVMITNAYGVAVASQAIMLESTTLTLPPYGESTGETAVPLGDANLDVRLGALTTTLPATGHTRFALVIGQDPDASMAAPVLRLLPLDFLAPSSGQFRAAIVDMVQSPDALEVTSPSGPSPVTVDRMTDGVVICDVGQRQPIRVGHMGATQPAPLAAFDSLDLPQEGAYYLVLAGRLDRHLANPGGLRAIPVVPGSQAVVPRPIYWVLNATDGPLFLCEGDTLIARIDADKLLGGVPSFSPTTPAGDQRTLALQDASTSASCDSSVGPPTRRELTLPEPMGMPSGRGLLAAVGRLGANTWGMGASLEAGPATMLGGQVVTYANATPVTIVFGSTEAPGLVSVMPLSTSSHEWATRPMDLQMKFGSMSLVSLAWMPTSGTAIVVGATDGATQRALELDTPFGDNWSYSPVVAP